jgi:sugar phosphate permease
LVSCLIISFFHRFAPAAFAGTLTREFGTSAAALGTLAALNLYVYTAMQIPAGVLIDRLGNRICVSAGTLAAAAGSVVFALAPTLTVAYLGPLLMGLGASTVFVGIMKSNTLWFSPAHYGVMAGVTMLLANIGSIAAAGPSAVLLRWFDWRIVFLAVGVLALLLAVGVYLLVQDRPEDADFMPWHPLRGPPPQIRPVPDPC